MIVKKTLLILIYLTSITMQLYAGSPLKKIAYQFTDENIKKNIRINFNNNSANYIENISRSTIKYTDHHPYRNAFIGNTLGTVYGSLLGVGFVKISGVGKNGSLESLGAGLIGIYLGSMVGGSIGSALAVKYKDVRHFDKILFRSFLPHLITSGIGITIFNSKKEGEIFLLGAFALGWLLTPINTVWAYKDYNFSVDITQNAGGPKISGSNLRTKSGNLMLSVSIKW